MRSGCIEENEMSNLPSNRFRVSLGGMLQFWKTVRSLSVTEIAAEAERPIHVACIGDAADVDALIARLAVESISMRGGGADVVEGSRQNPVGPADIRPYVSGYAQQVDAPGTAVVIDAGLANAGEDQLAARLARIVVEKPELRLSLARHIPAFRPAVAAQLVNEVSWVNAKIAVLSALPGVIPLTDILLPAAALGDMMLLTKNQVLLLLRIAAAYGLPVDLRARTRELVPVVGGAFGWRAIARELIGLVPGGIGVIVKGAVAYAGTYTVGKAATIYYSTGQSLTKPRLKRLYLDAYRSAIDRLKTLWRRGKSPKELASAIVSTEATPSLENASAASTTDSAESNGNEFASEVDKPVKIGV
jgi:uncharacterized protein (DUF697 family)